jgi:DNA-binding transcriptional ArsR family regulator
MEKTEALACLAALAQGTRLDIFRLLVQQGASGLAAGEIAAALGLAPATLSFHLKELASTGLVTARQDGRFIYYSADYATMDRLLAYLTENCCAADGTTCGPGTVCAPATKPRSTSRKVKR